MTVKCLIDGDIVIYQAAAVAQSTVYDIMCEGEVAETCPTKKDAERATFTQPVTGLTPYPGFSIVRRLIATAPVDTSIMAARAIIKNIVKTVDTLTQDRGGVSSHEIFLSGSDNFRIKAAKSKVYKGNRDPLARPLYYKEVKAYLSTASTVVCGMEADDALGTAQFSSPENTTCICTIDKDLRQIPGLHYNWGGDRSSTASVTTEEANRFFFKQLITGDSTDNIPGLFYFTKRKATYEIINHLYVYSTPEDMYNYVHGLYSKTPALDVDSILIEIGTLLWIRRRTGEDFMEHFGWTG